jgi:DNA-binding FrmR family transcriptional regulator
MDQQIRIAGEKVTTLTDQPTPDPHVAAQRLQRVRGQAAQMIGMIEDHLNCIELTHSERARFGAMRDVWDTVLMVADGKW